MGIEIERKFLVRGEDWRIGATGKLYRQGYITTVGGVTVRVRVAGEQGFITIKGKSVGVSRTEFEYPIPVTDAQEMLDNLCDRPLIEKMRYRIVDGDLVWEVDEFLGDNQGLIIAEVELQHQDQKIDLPQWIDREVFDAKYFNANLAQHPYTKW